MARKTAMDVTVMNAAGTDVLAFFETATVNITTETEDGKGATQRWASPVATGSAWSLELDTQVEGTAALVAKAVTSNPVGATNFTMDGTAYTGSAIIKTVNQVASRNAIQKSRIMLEGIGALVAGS